MLTLAFRKTGIPAAAVLAAGVLALVFLAPHGAQGAAVTVEPGGRNLARSPAVKVEIEIR